MPCTHTPETVAGKNNSPERSRILRRIYGADFWRRFLKRVPRGLKRVKLIQQPVAVGY